MVDELPEVVFHVYPADCDMLGHVNHATMLGFLERARWELLERLYWESLERSPVTRADYFAASGAAPDVVGERDPERDGHPR